MSNFPSVVRKWRCSGGAAMPLRRFGADLCCATCESSIFPPDRFSTAMPEFCLFPVSETKTRQPSFVGATIKGGPGRVTTTEGDAAGALQSSDWVCADTVSTAMSETMAIRNMRQL